MDKHILEAGELVNRLCENGDETAKEFLARRYGGSLGDRGFRPNDEAEPNFTGDWNKRWDVAPTVQITMSVHRAVNQTSVHCEVWIELRSDGVAKWSSMKRTLTCQKPLYSVRRIIEKMSGAFDALKMEGYSGSAERDKRRVNSLKARVVAIWDQTQAELDA